MSYRNAWNGIKLVQSNAEVADKKQYRYVRFGAQNNIIPRISNKSFQNNRISTYETTSNDSEQSFIFQRKQPRKSYVDTFNESQILNFPTNAQTTTNKQLKSRQKDSYFSSKNVSLIQYERVVLQCKNWATKYNQVYLKYINLRSSTANRSKNNSFYNEKQSGKEQLIQQNRRLKQKLRLQQNQLRNNKEISEQLQQTFQHYRQSTIKQCLFLIDQLKLSAKPAEQIQQTYD